MRAAANRVKLAVALAADSIRKKFNQLHSDRKETDRLLELQYKPITKKLSLVSSNDGDVGNVGHSPRAISSPLRGRRPEGGDDGGGGPRPDVRIPRYNALNIGVDDDENENELEQILEDIENERQAEVANEAVVENDQHQANESNLFNESLYADVSNNDNNDLRDEDTRYASPMQTSSVMEGARSIKRLSTKTPRTKRPRQIVSPYSTTRKKRLSYSKVVDDDEESISDPSDIVLDDLVDQAIRAQKRDLSHDGDSVIQKGGKTPRMSASQKEIIRHRLAREQDLQNIKILRDEFASTSTPASPPPPDWQALIQHSGETKEIACD